MHTQPIQNLQEAIRCLEKLPQAEQKQAFGYIDSLMLMAFDNQPKDSDLQASYLTWRKNYESVLASLDDGWTDEKHDEIWDNVRDKNDVGRGVSFE